MSWYVMVCVMGGPVEREEVVEHGRRVRVEHVAREEHDLEMTVWRIRSSSLNH